MGTRGGTACRRLAVVSSNGRREKRRGLHTDDPGRAIECRTGSRGPLSLPTGTATSQRTPSDSLRDRNGLRDAKQEQALEEVLLTCRGRFVRLAFSILKDQEDAEDAVQDAFVSAYRKFESFEGRSGLKTWLTRIVVNAALRIRRQRRSTLLRRVPDPATDGVAFVEKVPDVQLNPELAYSRAESFGFLDGFLKKMNPLLSEAVMMTYYEEMTTHEASAALDIPVPTYKARLFRGRRLLQEKARRRRVVTAS
jgi:RNA polymerase sigma-70 factor, ECF subfamily